VQVIPRVQQPVKGQLLHGHGVLATCKLQCYLIE